MIERTLARRYATALLDTAEKAHVVEEIEAQLLALKEAYEKDASFRMAMHHPKIPRSKKTEALRAVFAKDSPASLMAFLTLLVRKNRINLIPDIADVFDRLADRSRGVVRVEVSAWRDLTEPQRSGLLAKLNTILGGRKVDLTVTVNPRLLGGLAVRIGDTVYDGTVSGRLKALRESLTMPFGG